MLILSSRARARTRAGDNPRDYGIVRVPESETRAYFKPHPGAVSVLSVISVLAASDRRNRRCRSGPAAA